MAEETAVRPPVRRPALAGWCMGVLEATQQDKRAGVFTIARLFSLSCVASEKLQTNTTTCSVVIVPDVGPCCKAKSKSNSPNVESAGGEDRRPERCLFLPRRLVWRSFGGRQHRVSAFPFSCPPAGGRAQQGGTTGPLWRKTSSLTALLKERMIPQEQQKNAELAANCVYTVVILSCLYVSLMERTHLPFCLSKLS